MLRICMYRICSYHALRPLMLVVVCLFTSLAHISDWRLASYLEWRKNQRSTILRDRAINQIYLPWSVRVRSLLTTKLSFLPLHLFIPSQDKKIIAVLNNKSFFHKPNASFNCNTFFIFHSNFLKEEMLN